MKKLLSALVVAFMLLAAPAFGRGDDPKPTLRIITKITEDDAIGHRFLARVTDDLVKGIDADITTGASLEAKDATGPELRVSTIKVDDTNEVVIAVLTYHTQGIDDAPGFLATAAGILDISEANDAGDEVAKMVVAITGVYEGGRKIQPSAPKQQKLPQSHPETAMKTTILSRS